MSEEYVKQTVWTRERGFLGTLELEVRLEEGEGGEYVTLLVNLPETKRRIRVMQDLLRDPQLIEQLHRGMSAPLHFHFLESGDYPWISLRGIIRYGRFIPVHEVP
jgi:hypothetical protein